MPSDSNGEETIAPGYVSWNWWTRHRYWTNTDNYYNIPKVDLPVNEFVYGITDGGQEPWTYSYTNKSTGSTTNVYVPGIPFQYNKVFVDRHNLMQEHYFPYADWNAQANDVLLKALVKLSDQKINLALALAEASKTSDLILGTARRIDGAIRALRRGNFREVARQLNISPRAVHKTWLEYKYGWMPLLMDVQGAAEFFAQSALPQRQIIRATASISESRKGSDETMAGPYYDRYWPVLESWEGRVQTKCELRAELTDPRAVELQQLGLTNPALYVWERIPYSFVFDWFCSVGDWLTAQTAMVGLTLKTACIAQEEHTYYTWDQPAITPDDGSNLHAYGDRYAWVSRTQYWRRPISVDPELLKPRTVNIGKLGFQRLVTGLALLRANAPRGARI